MSKIVTMIPVRMASSRLPNKPLIDINGKTLIRRVYENVKKTIEGDIYVAAGDQVILDECAKFGAKALLTDPSLPSVTDRMNVDPAINNRLIEMVERTGCDIATCGMVFKSKEDAENPTNVKIVMGLREGEREGRCLYFTRAVAPYTRNPEKCPNQDLYHHIGIYVYKASSLAKIVGLPVGVLEARESLEQLRALENGMTIRAMLIDRLKLIEEAPADINTPEELSEALKYIK